MCWGVGRSKERCGERCWGCGERFGRVYGVSGEVCGGRCGEVCCGAPKGSNFPGYTYPHISPHLSSMPTHFLTPPSTLPHISPHLSLHLPLLPHTPTHFATPIPTSPLTFSKCGEVSVPELPCGKVSGKLTNVDDNRVKLCVYIIRLLF